MAVARVKALEAEPGKVDCRIEGASRVKAKVVKRCMMVSV